MNTLLELWKLGAEANRRSEPTADKDARVYGQSVHEAMAEKWKVTPNTVFKAKVFASQFTKAEAQELDKLGLSRSHGEVLTMIPSKQDRKKMARQAVKKKWNVRELRSQARALKGGVREYGGRAPAAKSYAAALEELRSTNLRLLNYMDLLTTDYKTDCSPSLLRSIKKLKSKLQDLKAVVMEELK